MVGGNVGVWRRWMRLLRSRSGVVGGLCLRRLRVLGAILDAVLAK